jgi:hypothetical protein
MSSGAATLLGRRMFKRELGVSCLLNLDHIDAIKIARCIFGRNDSKASYRRKAFEIDNRVKIVSVGYEAAILIKFF